MADFDSTKRTEHGQWMGGPLGGPQNALLATPPLTVDQEFAAKLSGLSSKTLGRFAARGEQVGRLKVGRRVLYHLPTLNAWLAAKAAVTGDAPAVGGAAR